MTQSYAVFTDLCLEETVEQTLMMLMIAHYDVIVTGKSTKRCGAKMNNVLGHLSSYAGITDNAVVKLCNPQNGNC